MTLELFAVSSVADADQDDWCDRALASDTLRGQSFQAVLSLWCATIVARRLQKFQLAAFQLARCFCPAIELRKQDIEYHNHYA